MASTEPSCCEFLNNQTGMASPFEKLLSLGYYDGTVSGLAQCRSCRKIFYYRLVAWDERQDIRIFFLAHTKTEVFDNLVELFSRFSQPRWPLWFPVLTAEETRAISHQIDTLLASIENPSYVIAAESPEKAIIAARLIEASEQSPKSADFPEPSEWAYWKGYLHL